MKLKAVFLGGVAGMLFALSAQAATLSCANGLELLALDGKALTHRSFDQVTSVDTDAGQHQVVFRYYNGVNKGGNRVIYSTQPYVFTIDMQQDDNVKLLVPKLTAYSQAQAYFHSKVDWKIQATDGTERSTQAVKLPGEGLAPFANIEKAVAAYNQKQGNQFAPQMVQVTVATPHLANKKLQKADDTLVQTVKMLFNNATPAQKTAIKQWMAQQ